MRIVGKLRATKNWVMVGVEVPDNAAGDEDRRTSARSNDAPFGERCSRVKVFDKM